VTTKINEKRLGFSEYAISWSPQQLTDTKGRVHCFSMQIVVNFK